MKQNRLKPDDIRRYRDRFAALCGVDNYSQERLARDLGVRPNTISRYELGTRSIPDVIYWALFGLERYYRDRQGRAARITLRSKKGEITVERHGNQLFVIDPRTGEPASEVVRADIGLIFNHAPQNQRPALKHLVTLMKKSPKIREALLNARAGSVLTVS